MSQIHSKHNDILVIADITMHVCGYYLNVPSLC